MQKRILFLIFAVTISLIVPAQRQMEKLDRGVAAFRTGETSAFISWRFLQDDPKNATFNVYRQQKDGKLLKLNEKPLLTATSIQDNNISFENDVKYIIKSVVNGKETKESSAYTIKAETKTCQYLSIPLKTPERYSPNDCSAADLDGDGQYEIVVHMSGVGRDNAHNGITTEPILQAYKLDGTFLWEINLGRNIREGAHYTQFMVYDFDGDGKAELICKTADGTKDGLGKIIGDANADWRVKPTNGNMDPWAGRPAMPVQITDSMRQRFSSYIQVNPEQIPDSLRQRFANPGQRPETLKENRQGQLTTAQMPDSLRGNNRGQNAQGQNRFRGMPRGDANPLAGKIISGPEYLTVFEGATGKALATVDYLPERGAPGAWGDSSANRGERYLAGVAYLDGKHPSAIMCRGYYTRATLVAWDWKNGKLTKRWMFDSYDGTPGNEKFSGQGNHSLSIADVDSDGCDEIVYGASVIDNDGKGLYSTGFGHGDALHCSDLDPERPGLEIFQVHENIRTAATVAAGHFRDARTGKLIWGLPATEDVGRGMCADIDPRYAGYECWSIASNGLYSAKGVKISDKQPRSCNFAIWWDGDLSRELLDKNRISKWDWQNGNDQEIFRAEDCTSINGTKSTPNLSADLFGDWREEVILSNVNGKELRIFSTTIPTDYRLVTLMQDPQYRLAIAWQNVAYNQPPHPGFFLGNGMKPLKK